MADDVVWEVRGCLDSELAGQKRFKYGNAKVGARLETRGHIIYVSLTADGRVQLSIGRSGVSRARLVLFGRLEDGGDGVVRINPSLLATGLTIDQEHYEQRGGISSGSGGRQDHPGYPGGPARPREGHGDRP